MSMIRITVLSAQSLNIFLKCKLDLNHNIILQMIEYYFKIEKLFKQKKINFNKTSHFSSQKAVLICFNERENN